jgi:exosortase/archaeosortase family protein
MPAFLSELRHLLSVWEFLRLPPSVCFTSGCVAAGKTDPATCNASSVAIPRERLFAFVYLLLTLNGLVTLAEVSAQEHGWLIAALNLFDVSAIIWLALAAQVDLLRRSGRDDLSGPSDRVILVTAIGAALVPIPVLSSALLTPIALWAWSTADHGAPLRRASAIVLALTTFLLWGRIALAWGAGPLLGADAAFVGWLAGVKASGNAVDFADGSRFLIAPGCSSLHGVSLGLILWTTVMQYFSLALDRRALLTLATALVGSVLVNGVRLMIIAWNPRNFAYWHTGSGAALFGWIALGVLMAVVYGGLGRARRLA